MTTEDYIWVPLSRLGCIRFGRPLGDAINRYRLTPIHDEEDDATDWVGYEDADDALRVYLENEIVISVHCEAHCVYSGKNLIGMPLEAALALLECPDCPCSDTIEIEGTLQGVYEVEPLSAQLWEKDGRIVTVCCGPEIEEDGDGSNTEN